MTNNSAVTFHPASSTLACDVCGSMIDSSEQGRAAHQSWHATTAEVIDLTGRVAVVLDIAS